MTSIKKISKYVGHQFIWVNLLAFILPIFARITPAMILVFAVMVLLQSKLRLAKGINQRVVLGFSAIYFLYLLGAIWSDYQESIGNELSTKLALLVFPILFLFTKKLPKKILHKVLLNFVLGCLVNLLLSIIKGIGCFQSQEIIECFYSSRISYGFHPSYSAMYMNLAIAILLYFDFNGISPYSIPRWLGRSLVLLLLAFVVLLSSKMGIFTLVIIFLLFGTAYARRLGWRKVALRSVVVVLLFIGFLWLSPTTYKRFGALTETVKTTLQGEEKFQKDVESNSARVNIWSIAIPLAFENFWFGIGTNDVSATLADLYNKNGMEEAARLQLNCHNQFIETQLSIGFLGLLMLLALVGMGVYLGIRKRNIIYLFFSLLCLANFMVESMLETQAGVVFFSFFNCFFFVQQNQLRNDESDHGGRSQAAIRKSGGTKQGL